MVGFLVGTTSVRKNNIVENVNSSDKISYTVYLCHTYEQFRFESLLLKIYRDGMGFKKKLFKTFMLYAFFSYNLPFLKASVRLEPR